ncbi:MAG: PLD nuclease N-terminal domain-containing protein [Lachnospiraceae bacterium]|jgi:hypothetical protein|nr:PLD nuclease N-terminal domain-containing protein [Lachnospiraceae bacterium]
MSYRGSEDLQVIMNYLPILIPLALLQFGLLIAAMIHILTHERYRIGNRLMWVVIVIFFNTLGPVFYFILGRGEPEEEDD